MERKESLLDEQHRPTYRAFRAMGMTEAAAFEATIGRARESAPSPHLEVEGLADVFERLGMTRTSAETAAAGRAHPTYEAARRTEAAEALEAVRKAQAADPKPKPKPARKPPVTAADLNQLVEAAIAKALSEQGVGTTRAQLSERTRQLVEADIADIEAGRLPSRRFGVTDITEHRPPLRSTACPS
jgi:hypothetical protein